MLDLFSADQIERIKPAGVGSAYLTIEQQKEKLIVGNHYWIQIDQSTKFYQRMPKTLRNKKYTGTWDGQSFTVYTGKSKTSPPEAFHFEDVDVLQNTTVGSMTDALMSMRQMNTAQLDVLQEEIDKLRKRLKR